MYTHTKHKLRLLHLSLSIYSIPTALDGEEEEGEKNMKLKVMVLV